MIPDSSPWVTLENHQKHFQYLSTQDTSQTSYIRTSEIPVQMSVLLKLPERCYCAARVENYCSSNLSNETLTFRADVRMEKREGKAQGIVLWPQIRAVRISYFLLLCYLDNFQ